MFKSLIWSVKGNIIYICGLRRSTFLCVGYILFYVSFLMAGAAVFVQLEQPESDKVVRRLKLAKLEFIEKNPEISRKYAWLCKFRK